MYSTLRVSQMCSEYRLYTCTVTHVLCVVHALDAIYMHACVVIIIITAHRLLDALGLYLYAYITAVAAAAPQKQSALCLVQHTVF